LVFLSLPQLQIEGVNHMNRLFKWLLFSVVFALAPLIADYFFQSVHPTSGVAAPWQGVFIKGELLLVSAAISGAGVGELIGTGKDWLPFKLLCGGCCIVILFVAVALYSGIANDVRLGIDYDKAQLATRSIWIFIATLGAGFGCILMAED
jgi:hypothetical protein